MEEQDLDWVIRDLNRLRSARAREHRARGTGSQTARELDEVIRAMEALVRNLQVRFDVKVETSVRECSRGVFEG